MGKMGPEKVANFAKITKVTRNIVVILRKNKGNEDLQLQLQLQLQLYSYIHLQFTITR